jgi:hypothetical protein
MGHYETKMFDGDDLAVLFADFMQVTGDDLHVRIAPVRRDSEWSPAVLIMRREGMRWIEDPLYCVLLSVEFELAELDRIGSRPSGLVPVAEGRRRAYIEMRHTIVEICDAAWGV